MPNHDSSDRGQLCCDVLHYVALHCTVPLEQSEPNVELQSQASKRCKDTSHLDLGEDPWLDKCTSAKHAGRHLKWNRTAD